MQTVVKLLERMQMQTIVKLLGGCSQIIGENIFPPSPPPSPGFGTPAYKYLDFNTIGAIFQIWLELQ